MIYLEFLEGQGLGNQLWNYVALRAITEKLGLHFKIINPYKFKGKEFIDIRYSSQIDKKRDNKIKNIFYESLFHDKNLKTYSSYFDKEVLKINPNTEIRGLFQSEKYLFDKDINNYIKIKNNFKKNNNLKNKCLINIRGGEYKRFKNLILPKKYWLDAIENIKKISEDITFLIVTDDYDYASKLLPNIKILKGNISQDFINLFSAEYVILSNSSFAYFPVSLGEKPKIIIAPAHWSRFGNNLERWTSPSNYYKGWKYQDKSGSFLTNKQIKQSIKSTITHYSNFYVRTLPEFENKKSLLFLFPTKFKKIIKKFLSKIFPMYLG